ncbi:unnamed protein product, partial [Brassica rapa subsp. narinosa]
MNRSKQLSKICSRPDLSIKCSKSKNSCSDDNDAICGYSDYDNSSDSSAEEENDCCFKITK